MKTFAVYKDSTGSFKAIVVNGMTARMIDVRLKSNWYGCNASSEKEAIKIALSDNFKG